MSALKEYGKLGESLAACVSAEVESVIRQRLRHESLFSDLSDVITPAKLAEKLDVSVEQIYALARGEQIPYFKVGKRDIRFLKQEIIRWMQTGGADFDSSENESSFTKDERKKIHALKAA